MNYYYVMYFNGDTIPNERCIHHHSPMLAFYSPGNQRGMPGLGLPAASRLFPCPPSRACTMIPLYSLSALCIQLTLGVGAQALGCPKMRARALMSPTTWYIRARTRVRYSFEGQTTMTYARKQPYRGRPSQSTRGSAGFTWSASRAGECMLRASTCRCPPSNLRALIEGQLIPSHHPRTAHPSIVPSSHRHPPRPPRHFSGAGSLARFPRTQPSYEDRKIGPRRPCAGLLPAAAHGGGRGLARVRRGGHVVPPPHGHV